MLQIWSIVHTVLLSTIPFSEVDISLFIVTFFAYSEQTAVLNKL